MSDETTAPASPCREFELLMMRKLDGEISAEDDRRLKDHLESCPSCAIAYSQFEKIVAATAHVRVKEPPREEWDLYWDKVANRLERGIAWALFTAGLAFVITYLAFIAAAYLVRSESIPFWAKVGIFALAAGLVLLFVSVAREKLALRKTDKYRGVKR